VRAQIVANPTVQCTRGSQCRYQVQVDPSAFREKHGPKSTVQGIDLEGLELAVIVTLIITIGIALEAL
jgi:hypothetical protein